MSGSAAEAPKSRVYEVLGLLTDEIQQGIKNLVDGTSKTEISTDIEELREESYKERAPEAEFALRLFRRFSDEAHNIKSILDRNKHKISDDSIMVELPSYLYETTSDQVSGFGAFNHNKFWLRALTCIFCFLSYVVMATVPQIGYAHLYPADAFLVCNVVVLFH